MSTPNDAITVDLVLHLGSFPSRSAGEAAVRELRTFGVPEERVGILTPSCGRTTRPRPSRADLPALDTPYTHAQVGPGRTLVAVRTEGPGYWVDELFDRHGATAPPEPCTV